MLSIWFFIGALLAIYGALILAEGVRDFNSQITQTAMSHLHLPVWWGIGLIILGGFYLVHFRPGRMK